MIGTELRVVAFDGFSLAATAFEPEGPARGAVVVASAMGVKRRFYSAFAGHLAQGGLAALTFDYRGIGDSRPAPQGAALHDWGILDVAAMLELAARRWPDVPLSFTGHSVGAQIFGLSPGAGVRRALFVAGQSGYYRLWRPAGSVALALLWWGMPLATSLFGRLPMSLVGQGEDVPPGVALEWARWGKNPLYVRSHTPMPEGNAFEHFQGELLSLAIEGDPAAPLAAVRALTGFYRSATAEVVTVSGAEAGLRLGHFDWFRPGSVALWHRARAFLGGT